MFHETFRGKAKKHENDLSFKNTYRFDFRKSLAPLYINGAAGVGVGVERLWGITMTTDIFVECMTQQYIQEAI